MLFGSDKRDDIGEHVFYLPFSPNFFLPSPYVGIPQRFSSVFNAGYNLGDIMSFEFSKSFKYWLMQKGALLFFPFAMLYAYFDVFVWNASDRGDVYSVTYYVLMAGVVANSYILIDFFIFLFRPKRILCALDERKIMINNEEFSIDRVILNDRGNTFKVWFSFRRSVFWSSYPGYKVDYNIKEFESKLHGLIKVDIVKDNGII